MNTLIKSINTILIISIISCANQNKNKNNGKFSTNTPKQEKIDKIQLTERTRGVNRNSVFTPTFKTAVSNSDSTRSAMPPSEWDKITKQAEALDLSKISELQSPTTGRYSDRALSATLIITSGGTTYTSATFDAGHPPKELEALYNTIRQPKVNRKNTP